MHTTATTPFEILLHIEQLSRSSGVALPRAEIRKPIWKGIGFRFGNEHLLAVLGEVQEILECPALTPVPRTKPWMRGVANIRGRLLPVVDLGLYLGERETPLTAKTRVMVVHMGALSAGLLVDEVLGKRQFYDEEILGMSTTMEGWKKDYSHEQWFRRDEQDWMVFNMRSLVLNPRFMLSAV